MAYQGNWSDDADLKERLVEDWVAQARAMLISQAISKRQNISTVWLQTPVIKLAPVDSSLDKQNPLDCYILRSVNKLPRTIETYDDNNIISVTTIDNAKTFTKTNVFRSRTSKYSRFTGLRPKYYLLNDFLYIQNTELIEELLVTGIFENPREVGRFMTQQNQEIWSVDSQYPISNKMEKDIISIVFNEHVLPFKQMTVDDTNNANDDTAEGGGAARAQKMMSNEAKRKE